jgi:hypothetical protein
MAKKKARPRARRPPYYIAVRLQSVEELEAKLNEFREQGFMIKDILCGLETYTVVALMPEL